MDMDSHLVQEIWIVELPPEGRQAVAELVSVEDAIAVRIHSPKEFDDFARRALQPVAQYESHVLAVVNLARCVHVELVEQCITHVVRIRLAAQRGDSLLELELVDRPAVV